MFPNIINETFSWNVYMDSIIFYYLLFPIHKIMIGLNIDCQSLLPDYNGSCVIFLKYSEPQYIPFGYILLNIHVPLSGRASPRFGYFLFSPLEKDVLL